MAGKFQGGRIVAGPIRLYSDGYIKARLQQLLEVVPRRPGGAAGVLEGGRLTKMDLALGPGARPQWTRRLDDGQKLGVGCSLRV